jgi:nitrogen fixation/metabolism regulation signal transduction histidine kinase
MSIPRAPPVSASLLETKTGLPRLDEPFRGRCKDHVPTSPAALACERAVGRGGGARELLIRSSRAEGNGVTVTIRDSGKGLEPDEIERLFDAFYTTKDGGLGIGLTISRSIIEDHGGHIRAARNQPRGAVLAFTLPAGGEAAR